MELQNFLFSFSLIQICTSFHVQNIQSSSSFNPHINTISATTPLTDYEDINSKSRKSEILEIIIDRNGYDSKIRPPSVNGSGPTQVTIGIYLRSVENVDDVRMQYSVQMTFWQEWIDPRLQYSHIQNNIQYLQLTEPKRVWMPDVFFQNEKSGYLHELIVPNLYTRLYPNGRILQSYRISLVLPCTMNLRAYPLDIQTCPIVLESYAWTTKDVTLNWRKESPVRLASEFNTARFSLKEFHSSTCLTAIVTGNYSCLVLHIKFAREFGFYLIQIYLPCSMLVVVSWVSFWLEPSAVEARVSLGVTTILTIVTQTYGINQSAPPASYAKALDVWTAWCQMLVFGALLEFALVNYLCHVRVIKATHQLIEKKIDEEGMENEKEKLLSLALARAKRIDRLSKIMFPISFAIFNVCYWYHYLVYHY